MNREEYISRVTIFGSIINFLLVLFKFAAGILGHSSAMIADAAHSLSDFGSDLVVLLCIRVAGKPADDDHTYGHGKFETLATVIIALLLLGTGLGLFWDGFTTISSYLKGPTATAPTGLALAAALISIIVKEGLYHYTLFAAKKADSSSLKTNAWHHRSDALSSLATVAGIGGAMLLGGKWIILDPLAACIISIFIIGMGLSLLKPGLDELMEKSLPPAEKAIIEDIIATMPGVNGYHRLRTRRVGGARAIEAHIKLDGNMSLHQAHDIATSIEIAIKNQLGQNTHVGIHMEPASDPTFTPSPKQNPK